MMTVKVKLAFALVLASVLWLLSPVIVFACGSILPTFRRNHNPDSLSSKLFLDSGIRTGRMGDFVCLPPRLKCFSVVEKSQ